MGSGLVWLPASRNTAWLKVPDIKMYGYRGAPSKLRNAIQRVQPQGFYRLEVVFGMAIDGGLPKLASELGPLLQIAGLQNPAFSYDVGKKFTIVLKRSTGHELDKAESGSV